MLLKSETWRSLPPSTVEFPVESTILFAFWKYGKMMESFTVPWMKFFARMFMRKDYWWCSLAFRRRSSRLHLCHHRLFHQGARNSVVFWKNEYITIPDFICGGDMKAWGEQRRDRAQNPGALCIAAAARKQAVRAGGGVMKREKALKAGIEAGRKQFQFSMQIRCWWGMVLVGHSSITIRDCGMCLMSF